MKKMILLLTLMALALLAIVILDAQLTQVEVSAAPPAKRPTPPPMPPPPEWKPPETVSEGFRDPYPDLIVTEITTMLPNPIAGVTETIKVTIKNESDAYMPLGTFYVDLYIDPAAPPVQLQPGDLSKTAQLFLPRESLPLYFSYVFTQPGGYNLWAQVDTDNHVVESNEDNNVKGPLYVTVQSYDRFQDRTHEDFQKCMASNLDISHPQGVIRQGIFLEPQVWPWSEADLYNPDIMINDVTGTVGIDTSWAQVKPSLVNNDGGDSLYLAWQDGRGGGVCHRQIYLSSSSNRGDSWAVANNVRISPTDHDQVAPALAYASGSTVYAVWQDDRENPYDVDCDGTPEGDYDIYFARSDNNGQTWPIVRRVNDNMGRDANQLSPSIAVGDDPNEVHVVWVDRRNGNDDVYYSRSTDGGVTWSSPDTFVTDDPRYTKQDQRSPTVDVGYDDTVWVTWEDWRDPQHPEVYTSWSLDDGHTFGIDVPITIVDPWERTTDRRDPTIAAETLIQLVKEEVVIPGTDPPVITYVIHEIPVDVLNVAWQEVESGDTDIYYSWAWHSHDEYWLPNKECPYPYDFCFEGPIQLNGFYIESDYALPPEGKPLWPYEPSWQGEVDMTKSYTDDLDTYECMGGGWYAAGTYVVWSDGRSFDNSRHELYVARVAHPGEYDEDIEMIVIDTTTLERICANEVLNDNAKIFALRDDPEQYADPDPACTAQHNPSIAIHRNGLEEYLALAWDDDRWDTPLITETYRNRNVFLARTPFSSPYSDFPPPTLPYGIYISRIFDTGALTPTWGILDWWGATDHGTPIYFQTRTGNNPNPPKDGLAGGGWSAWDGPNNGYYDAPGQPIVSPQRQFIQYKAIIAGPSRLTALSEVTIYHGAGGENKIYLPIILKNY